MSHDDSEIIDLEAICARASASPARDLTPPDLFSVAPPAFTRDIDDAGNTGIFASLLARKSRMKLAAGAGVAALLMLGVVFGSAGKAEPAQASARMLPPPAAAAPLPEPVTAPVMPEVAGPLPAPPTTGAPATVKAPPRFVPPAMAMKARAPASGGPKMTKVQSTGVASR